MNLSLVSRTSKNILTPNFSKFTVTTCCMCFLLPEQVPMGARSSSTNIWGWAVTRGTCLNDSTITTQGPTPDASCHGTKSTCIVGSSVIRRGLPDCEESCIVLQSRPTRSLIAKFPQRSVVACSPQILCCSHERTRPQMGVCEPLMPDVVAPKVHQNNCSYVSLARIHYMRIYHGGRLRGKTMKTTKLSKLEVGTSPGQHGT